MGLAQVTALTSIAFFGIVRLTAEDVIDGFLLHFTNARPPFLSTIVIASVPILLVTASGYIFASPSASAMWKKCWRCAASRSAMRLSGSGALSSTRVTPTACATSLIDLANGGIPDEVFLKINTRLHLSLASRGSRW